MACHCVHSNLPCKLKVDDVVSAFSIHEHYHWMIVNPCLDSYSFRIITPYHNMYINFKLIIGKTGSSKSIKLLIFLSHTSSTSSYVSSIRNNHRPSYLWHWLYLFSLIWTKVKLFTTKLGLGSFPSWTSRRVIPWSQLHISFQLLQIIIRFSFYTLANQCATTKF